MKHILVVDDDARLRELLKRFLVKEGFQVSESAETATAEKLLLSFDFDLLIVDVMMPGEDGMSFVQRMRAEGRDVPVLMLTAKSEIDDRLEGFEAGVDDFLTKPFEPRELVMRMEAILRRSQAGHKESGVVIFGDYRFDRETMRLAKGDEKIDLTRNERAVLALFLGHLGEVVTREEISEILGEESNLRNVDVTITRLRKKIEKDPKNPKYIHTLRGKGYKLQPTP